MYWIWMTALKCMNTNFLRHIFNSFWRGKLHLSQLCVYISIKIKHAYKLVSEFLLIKKRLFNKRKVLFNQHFFLSAVLVYYYNFMGFFIEQIIDKFQIAHFFGNKSLYLDNLYLNIECRSQMTALFAFISQFCVVVPLSYLFFFGISGIYYRNEINNLNDTKCVT